MKSSSFQHKIVIGNIYRPPRNLLESFKTFYNELEPILQKLNSNTPEIIITGDFNIDLLKANTNATFSDFFDLVTTHNFIPKITLPTRFSERTATLIDNFLCSFKRNIGKEFTGIDISALSDHFPYFIFLKVKTKKLPPPKYIEVNRGGEYSVRRLIEDIKIKKLDTLIHTDENANPDENYKIIIKVIEDSIKNHFPKKTEI